MVKPLNKTILGLTLALASAGLLILSFSSIPCGLLIWISFVPMIIGQYCLLPQKIASLSPAIAIGLWLGILLIPIFGGKSSFMAALPLAAGAIVYLTDRGKRSFHQKTGFRWFVLEGVAGWVGLEMIRSLIPAIGTWLFVGYPLWRYPALLQPLSIFGIYGLDLLIMGCNYAIGLAAIWWIDQRQKNQQPLVSPKTVGRSAGAVGGLLLAWLFISLGMVSQRPGDELMVRAAAIQPNLPRAAHRDDQYSSRERIAVLAEMTREASDQGAALIVWPEMALGFDPRLNYSDELKQLARETGAYLVIGYVLEDGAGFRNEAVLLTPAGEFLEPYGKAHPMVTSGEPKSVLAGRYPVYETGLGKLGIMICFDAHFTDVARALSRQGAQLIANPALFGASIASLPHTQVVFRAIENRTAIVMADVAYNSAIVDPYGKVVKSVITPEGEEAILVADVSTGGGSTVYARYGDWLGWVSLVGLLVFGLGMNWYQRKKA
ncbi:MAG: apolipoprotein N-acyltransferase [Anaerolineales bacterium]|nr:apolipoprotein N-acyltransferase [Anaerolineales bacterium]